MKEMKFLRERKLIPFLHILATEAVALSALALFSINKLPASQSHIRNPQIATLMIYLIPSIFLVLGILIPILQHWYDTIALSPNGITIIPFHVKKRKTIPFVLSWADIKKIAYIQNDGKWGHFYIYSNKKDIVFSYSREIHDYLKSVYPGEICRECLR